MASEYRKLAYVLTLPAHPGLQVSVRNAETDEILLSGELDGNGEWRQEHDIDDDEIIFLVLENNERELMRCKVKMQYLRIMECLMRDPPKLSEKELHRRWRDKYAEMQAGGIKSPDPEAVARKAFKY